MYIRETLTKNPKTGALYKVHRLVEAVRTEKGPRQRVVLHLGTLSLSKIEQKKLAKILEARLLGQKSLFEDASHLVRIADEAMANLAFRKTAAKEENESPPPDIHPINLDSIQIASVRTAGAEIIGHTVWEKLGFRLLLKELGMTPVEIALAETTVLGRLIHPGSERATYAWINQRSALLELLFQENKILGRDGLYEIADRLLEHKMAIESHLRKKEQELFPSSVSLFLYDLTNTYFEGQALKNTLAKRGHSKEKRNDRPLVTLALLVDNQGFPIFSQIYKGNQSEPATLRSILDRLERDVGKVLPAYLPTIVMDKGIATADNVILIRDKGFPYVIVERRRAEKDHMEEFSEPSGFLPFETNSGPIKLKKLELDGRSRVLVISEGRVLKERAMDALKEKRCKEEVEKLATSVQKGNVILPEKVGRRIGRILQKYPSMAAFYEIVAEPDETGKRIIRVGLKEKDSRPREEIIRGCYVIETSHQNLEPKAVWDLYTTLHTVEHAFRCLKTDLGIRPIHHQKNVRTEGHLFISVLAYHLLITIENTLRKAGDFRSWSTIREIMSTMTRATVTCADADGCAHSIRITSSLESNHRKILDSLKVKIPFRKIRQKIQAKVVVTERNC
jgi:transposase